MSVQGYAWFASNLVQHWQRVQDLLPRFGQVEIQYELVSTRRNAAGQAFTATGQTPADWLRERGVEPWLYVNARWPYAWSMYGKPAGNPESNVYWFRQEQTDALNRNNWWLYGRDANGKRSPVMGNRKAPAPDMANQHYLDWLLERLGDGRAKRIRFDDAWVHHHGYFRPWRVGWPAGDSEQNEGTWWLYDELRERGVEVMANGAWEMADPEADTWKYPAAGHVDGVMIELPTGFARWDGGAWWALNDDRMMQVASDWLLAGVHVVLVAAYDGLYGVTWEQYAGRYAEMAEDFDMWLSLQRADAGSAKGVDVIWLPQYRDATATPAEPDLRTIVQALRRDVAELSARVEALEEAA